MSVLPKFFFTDHKGNLIFFFRLSYVTLLLYNPTVDFKVKYFLEFRGHKFISRCFSPVAQSLNPISVMHISPSQGTPTNFSLENFFQLVLC